MKNSKVVALTAAALASVVALAGCAGGAPTASSTPQATEFPDGTSIDYWLWLDVPTDTTIYDLADEFKKETNITVNIQADVAASDYFDHLVNAIAADAGPDVTMTKTTDFGQLADADVLAPLDDYIDGWANAGDINPSYWPQVTNPADGKIYSMPQFANIQLLYYRADMLEAAGVKPPTTQAEMVKAAEAVFDPANGRYGYASRGGVSSASTDPWAAWLLAAGASFTDSKGDIDLDSAAARAANETYLSMYPYANPGALNDGTAQVMANIKAGTVAMMISHLGKWKELNEALGDDIGVTFVPSLKGDQSTSTALAGLNSNAILANSENKDAAFAWISFLSEKKAQLAHMASPNGYLSVIDDVVADPQFKDNDAVQVSLKALQESKSVVSWPNVPGTSIVANVVWSPLYQGAILGQNSADALVEGVDYTLKNNEAPR